MTERVYIIRVGADGPVKIGRSKSPKRRLLQLQIGFAGRLTLIRVLDGGLKEERWMHQQFLDHRIAGEWFRFQPTMLEAVPPESLREAFLFPEELADEADEPSARSAMDDFLFMLMRQHYSHLRRATHLLGADGGVRHRTAENWLQGACLPQAVNLIQLMVANSALGAAVNEFISGWRSGNAVEMTGPAPLLRVVPSRIAG